MHGNCFQVSTRRFALVCVLLVTGCAAVPITGVVGSNVLVERHYQKKYQAYDQAYREKYQFNEHFIPRDGHKLYVREFGHEHAEQGGTLVMMHGFPDSLHLYDRIAPRLGQHGRVLSFDFLGWGNSDKPANHGYDSNSLYRDLEVVVDYFDLEDVSLVVHDASGPPGIEWALDNEQAMDTLYLLNTYYHPMEKLVAPEAIALFSTPGLKRSVVRTGARISHYGWSLGFTNQVEKFFATDEQRQIFMPVFMHQAMAIKPAFFGLNNVLQQELEQRRHKQHKLAGYQKPVKIIFGADDPYLNRDVAKKFNQLFPNSELILIDRARHYVQVDRPGEVAGAMLKEEGAAIIEAMEANIRNSTQELIELP